MLLSTSTPARALDPAKAVTQYVHASFGTDNGLPQSSVNAVAQTADGYLWLGTQDGLARFDGLRFKIFSNRDADGFRDNFVSSLFVDQSGVLWVGTDGGDLLRYAGGTFEALPHLASHSVSIRAITQSSDGAIWIASSGSGAHRLLGTEVTSLTKSRGLPDDVVVALERRREGGVWIGTASGLARSSGDQVTAVLGDADLGSITALAESPDGTLWVGTMSGTIAQVIKGRVTRRWGKDEGFGKVRITALRVDRDAGLWIGTEGQGVARLRDDRISLMARAEGLSDDTTVAIFEDREGSIWVGTEGGGLNVLKESRFLSWTAREGLTSNDVSSVLEARDGTLLVGTYKGGLNRLMNGGLSAFTPESGFSSEAVVGLTEDRAGDVWVGSMRSPLFVYRHRKLEPVKVRDGLPNQGSRAVYQDHEGVIWAGAPRGKLLRLDGANESVIQVPDVGTAILSLGGDSQGTLWVGTYSEGLRRRSPDGVWSALTTADGLSSDMVLGFYEDAFGSMWISTHRGLNRWKNGAIKAITARDGLYHDAVYQTLEDDDGAFWMCSDRGLSRTPRAELAAFADGRLARVTHRSFGIADGMKSVECNNGSPSGFKGRDGRLYFATMGGVVVVDPKALHAGRAPPVLLEEVVADGRVAYAHESGHTSGEIKSAAPVTLDPGLKNIEFRYATPSFLDPTHLTARYRLEGFDKDWIDAGLRRTAYYTNLAPGRYRFSVMACNADAVCSEDPSVTSFVLLPHFYETRAFYALCALAALSSTALLWLARTRQFRRRAAELEELVAQRTVELSALNARLESIARIDDLTGLANRRRFNAVMDIEWRRAQRNGSPLSVVLVDVDDFKAYNDHYGHQGGDECLRRVAEALQGATGRAADVVARYGGEEFVILLPETPEAGCRVVAERARAAVEAMALPHARSRVGGVVTLSAGRATVIPLQGVTPDDVVKAADDALYRAKRGGRNRVESSTI